MSEIIGTKCHFLDSDDLVKIIRLKQEDPRSIKNMWEILYDPIKPEDEDIYPTKEDKYMNTNLAILKHMYNNKTGICKSIKLEFEEAIANALNLPITLEDKSNYLHPGDKRDGITIYERKIEFQKLK